MTTDTIRQIEKAVVVSKQQRIADKAFYLGARFRELDWTGMQNYRVWAYCTQIKAMLGGDDRLYSYPALRQAVETSICMDKLAENGTVYVLMDFFQQLSLGKLSACHGREPILYGIYADLVHAHQRPYSPVIAKELEALLCGTAIDSSYICSGGFQRMLKDRMLFWPIETTVSLLAYQLVLPAVFHGFCPLVPLDDGMGLELALDRARKHLSRLRTVSSAVAKTDIHCLSDCFCIDPFCQETRQESKTAFIRQQVAVNEA
ncbi:MAG: hypothetical protein LKE40_01540 [Spirochaetia bacterium]|nr:hypothetical protein [Spirochaetia bacterium]